jgi:CheY-like chemotaxis protein
MSSHCVLVVEDNQDMRDTLVELLQGYGYEAVGAEHGQDALDKLKGLDARPCIIVLDLMMPVMDGRSFRQAQLQTPEVADIPVVVISAYDVIPYVQELKATAYLRKPLNLKELMRVVEQHC